jgi:replicative DNA helicase
VSIHLLLGAYYPVLMFLLYYSLPCVISIFVSFPFSLNYRPISTFVLFFLISEKTYKEISQNKQDKTYVRTSAVEQAMHFLHEHGVVILSGREGTGKSKMCLEIASLCQEEDYMPYKVDGYADLEVNFESSKVLCILLMVRCTQYNFM